MIQKLDSLKKQLSELAVVLNAFKSEAVQLRILDFVLGEESLGEVGEKVSTTRNLRKSHQRRAKTPKKTNSAASGTQKKASSGAGAYATLTQLLAGTFFDKPRTINDIIE